MVVVTPREAPQGDGLVYQPQPKQSSWHSCWAYESGFGGAKFGGKTLALLMDMARYHKEPEYKAIIFRRTFPRLQEVIDRSFQWYPSLGGSWNGDYNRWTFPSGATIALRHCQHEMSKYDYQGHQYTGMGFDQLEEFTETQYDYLCAQNRSPTGRITPFVRSTFNPGGIGHSWVKRRFISHGTRECAPWVPQHEVTGTRLATRCFHFANIDDNPKGEAADPSYRLRLESQPEDQRRAFLYGDWDSFAGQVFSEWDPSIHVVTRARLDPSWKRLRAIDYGIARPFVCHWLAYDRKHDRVFVYRSLSQAGVVPAKRQAQMILQMTPRDEPINLTVADPALWIRQEHGRSIAEEYGDAGLPMQKAINDRLTGKARVHDYLALGPDGLPKLQVFSSCLALITNLPSLVHDQLKVEDVDTDGPDDEYDALRYGLMAIPLLKASIHDHPTQFRFVPDYSDQGRRTAMDEYREWQRNHRIIVDRHGRPMDHDDIFGEN